MVLCEYLHYVMWQLWVGCWQWGLSTRPLDLTSEAFTAWQWKQAYSKFTKCSLWPRLLRYTALHSWEHGAALSLIVWIKRRRMESILNNIRIAPTSRIRSICYIHLVRHVLTSDLQVLRLLINTNNYIADTLIWTKGNGIPSISIELLARKRIWDHSWRVPFYSNGLTIRRSTKWKGIVAS